MDFLEACVKGSLTSILVVAGVAMVAPVILPVVISMARPIVKGVIKGGMALAEKPRSW